MNGMNSTAMTGVDTSQYSLEWRNQYRVGAWEKDN